MIFPNKTFRGLIFFLLIPLLSNAKLFRGTIGKYPIIIDFPIKDIGVHFDNGGYFYETKRQKIIFREASGTENHITLRVGYESGNEFEEFDLTKNQNGSYLGTWKNKLKNTLLVQITPFDSRTVKNSYYTIKDINDGDIDELWYMATTKLTFIKDTSVVVGKHQIDWYSDNIYGISFFRIGTTQNPKLNKLLLKKHIELIDNVFRGCDCDGESYEPFDIDEVGESIISYSFHEGICYCFASAHPVWGEKSESLDLQRDKILDFDEVFSFTNISVPNKEKVFLAWSAFRKKYVAPKIIELLKMTDKTLLSTPQNYERMDDGECYFLENEYWWSLENWRLKKNSLSLLHLDNGAQGYGPCIGRFEIPIIFLKPFVRESYKKRIFLK